MPALRGYFRTVMLILLLVGGGGCGSTQQREATEQLLTSDAVDRSVAQIDFRALSGETVYFDTTYLKNIKGVGFVNAEYITSSLRQQLVAARCLLRDKKEEADYVVEARIGTLGTDRHEVTYGMPANNFLNAASTLVPNSPPLPTLPELALAKRNEQLAAAKIGAFAYHQETGEPVWQSGIAPIRSTAKDIWILGAGPIQRGEIYGGTQFAGTRFGFSHSADGELVEEEPLVDYGRSVVFDPQLHQPKMVASNEPESGAGEGNSRGEDETKKNETPIDQKPKPGDPEPKKKDGPTETPGSANSIKSGKELESGLRLRIRFDEPDDGEAPTVSDGRARGLFRLDPEELSP